MFYGKRIARLEAALVEQERINVKLTWALDRMLRDKEPSVADFMDFVDNMEGEENDD